MQVRGSKELERVVGDIKRALVQCQSNLVKCQTEADFAQPQYVKPYEQLLENLREFKSLAREITERLIQKRDNDLKKALIESIRQVGDGIIFDVFLSFSKHSLLRYVTASADSNALIDRLLARIATTSSPYLFFNIMETYIDAISSLTDGVEVGQVTLANNPGGERMSLYYWLSLAVGTLSKIDRRPHADRSKESRLLRALRAVKSTQAPSRDLKELMVPIVFDLILLRVEQGWYDEAKTLYTQYGGTIGFDYLRSYVTLANSLVTKGAYVLAMFFLRECLKNLDTDKHLYHNYSALRRTVLERLSTINDEYFHVTTASLDNQTRSMLTVFTPKKVSMNMGNRHLKAVKRCCSRAGYAVTIDQVGKEVTIALEVGANYPHLMALIKQLYNLPAVKEVVKQEEAVTTTTLDGDTVVKEVAATPLTTNMAQAPEQAPASVALTLVSMPAPSSESVVQEKVKTRPAPVVPVTSIPAAPVNIYAVWFPGFSDKKMISFGAQGIPEGIYCGYLDITNPQDVISPLLTKFNSIFFRGNVVGRFAEGFVFLKSHDGGYNQFKIRIPKEDWRLYGILRAVSTTGDGKKHFLYQFGLFRTHKQARLAASHHATNNASSQNVLQYKIS